MDNNDQNDKAVQNMEFGSLDDEALDNVSGGATQSHSLKFKVTNPRGAAVHKKPDVKSHKVGEHPFSTILICSKHSMRVSDGGKWYYVPAQHGVATGYIQAESVKLL